MSLLEVLVALAAGVGCLAVLLPAISNDLQRLRRDGLRSQAALLAARHIEQLSAWPAAEPVPAEGVEGALRWAVRQVRVDVPRAQGAGSASLRHFRITVHAPGDRSPLVDLVIRRLGEPVDPGAARPGAVR
jgi:hypothetical protein